MSEKNKLKSSIKYPTSLIIKGNNFLGVEIAKSLIEQGGYVIVIDQDVESTLKRYEDVSNKKLLTVLDLTAIDYLDEDLRRLDYVFYLGHEANGITNDISSQELLQSSNYLDMIIRLTHKFEAKILLSSSIHAYQAMMTNGNVDTNFEIPRQSSQTMYTQMEIQRYSESLLLESVEKFGIDARIVRMGRVIGKYMDFDPDNSFDKMVFQAAKGEDLSVESDGLETNMYIHVLDAAYGLIKAMFTKGTKGKIYSLSNEEEITDLSIAYKLQELTGQNSEIKFIDSKNTSFPIKFHKPGINLSTVGWSPRVSFTRAISQVMDYASDIVNKITEKNENNENPEWAGNENITGQGQDGQNNDFADEPKGALARLIAERKAQEKARKGSILMAGEQARERTKKRRQLTTSEKIQRKFQAMYDSMAFKLTFLKKVTIAEAFFYLVLLIIFVIVYIGLISPVFVIGKNLVQIEYYKNRLDQEAQEGNLSTMSKDMKEINSSISDISNNVEKLEIIFKVFGEEKKFIDVSNHVRYMKLYSDQLYQASEQMTAFDSYWENSDLGITYQPNSESLFTVTKSDIDTAELEKVKSYDTRIKSNIDGIRTSSDTLSRNEPVRLFGYNSADTVETLKVYESKTIEILEMIDNYSDLIIRQNDATYAIIIQDNSRYTPGGGYPSSIGYIHFQDNKVVDVNLTELNDTNDNLVQTLTESEKKQIQASSSTNVDTGAVNFSELFLINDRSEIDDDIRTFYEANYGVTPDAIFFMDLETLAKIFDITGPVELNQVKVESDGFLNSINLLQGNEASKTKRNEIITNIFAAQINSVLKDKNKFYQLLPILFNSSKSASVYVESDDANIKEELISDENVQISEDFVHLAVTVDPELVNPELFPSINLKIEDFINKDLTITRNVIITQGSTQDIDRVITCLPSGAKNFNLKESDASLGQTFFEGEVCVVGDYEDGKAMSFSYELSKGIENLSSGGYNKSLEIISSAGLDVIYDYEAGLASGYSIVEEQNTIISNQKVIETGTVEGKEYITYKFTK